MTASELRNIFYEIVSSSGVQISGDFYTGHEGSNNRASSSELEDVVINVISGTTDQDQAFIVVINTFVQDIESGGEGYDSNDLRLEYFDTFWSEFFDDYSRILELDGRSNLLTAVPSSAVKIVAVPDVNQHFVSVRLNVIVDKF